MAVRDFGRVEAEMVGAFLGITARKLDVEGLDERPRRGREPIVPLDSEAGRHVRFRALKRLWPMPGNGDLVISTNPAASSHSRYSDSVKEPEAALPGEPTTTLIVTANHHCSAIADAASPSAGA
ncbi:MAG: hypothetical protein HYR51_16785 [Candidatus Rokubacteria bacterium]|nr:hypothetical protein [Candidatus Rokubacteria bacterium]